MTPNEERVRDILAEFADVVTRSEPRQWEPKDAQVQLAANAIVDEYEKKLGAALSALGDIYDTLCNDARPMYRSVANRAYQGLTEAGN